MPRPHRNWPLVSIGLPVFNGERYLRIALDSLLAQDYPNFEIIISDNDSSDNTKKIVERYVTGDQRITYTRCPPGGIASTANFSRALSLCHGHYFMWAAHHVRWDPTFVSTCVKHLEKGRDLVLVSSQISSLNPDTQEEVFLDHGISTIGLSSANRVKTLIASGLRPGLIFYGIYKRHIISEVPLRVCIGGDHVFLAELALRGEFFTFPQTLLSKNTGGSSKSWESIAAHERITNKFVISHPWLSREWELQKMILGRSRLSLLTKLSVSAFSLRQFLDVQTRRKKLVNLLWEDLYHHIIPLLLGKSKPEGTGNPSLLPKVLGKWGRRN